MVLVPPKKKEKKKKSASGRLHLNTRTPLTQQSRSGLTMLSRHGVRAYQGNEVTRNSSGNTLPQSSQLAEPLWTDPWPEEWSWCARADLHLKNKRKKKTEGGEFFVEIYPQILVYEEKSYHTVVD